MARSRSRRTYRRSASQTAASLLALALPAPVQRVADTRLGPLLMLVGVPTAIVAGIINIDWSGGTPSLSIDQQRAAEIRNVAREKLNNFESQGGLQQFGQAATDLIGQAQNYAAQNYGTQGYGTQGYGTPGYSTPGYSTYANAGYNPTIVNQSSTYGQTQPTVTTRNPSAGFPSTQPLSNTAQLDYRYATPTATANSAATTQSAYRSPAQPSAQPHSQQQYAPWSASSSAQQSASPSDTRPLTYQQQQLYLQQQQQLYQQQLQQQQLQEQQLRHYQYQQWLAQQPSATQPTATLPYTGSNQSPATNPNYSQTDAYGRPVATGYSQPTVQLNQYGQPVYDQGSATTNPNSRGRY